ncbi:malonic semialdehyde reductase [Kutzneria sp. NPDC051319]|uniref:malonic semialdehyde reductase n=1 Tax=Kutzneria sp. NPDC051319 TaxID=3155047 RepID=UPI0034416887
MTATLTDVLELERSAQELLFHEARTANTFADEPVSDEQLRAIYDLVKWAPTSMNIQPLRVSLVRSAEARARLLPHMSEGNRGKTGTAPVVAILSADSDFHEHLHRTFPHVPNAKDRFPDAGKRAEMARFNALLQVGYFILGVRAAGLSAGPMTGFDAAGVREEFFADGTQEPLVIVNIGKPGPDAWFPRLPRLEFDEAVEVL